MQNALPLNATTLADALSENIPPATLFHLGGTPESLLQQGFAPLPLVTSAKLLGKMHFDHGVFTRHLLRIPELIAAPHSIYQSEALHVPAGLTAAVLILTTEEKGTLPIVIPIHGGKAVGRTPTNWVASMYAKDKPEIIRAWDARGLLLWTRPVVAVAT